MKRNGIECGARERYYSGGRINECRFQYRYGTYDQFTMPMARTYVPIYGQKKMEEYFDKQTKLLAEIWRLNPPKKKQS